MPVDRTHEETTFGPFKKEVRKVKFCPLLERNYVDMTYGKIYEAEIISQCVNGNTFNRFFVTNDAGVKVFMNQELFDDLPLRNLEPSEEVYEEGCIPVETIDTSIEALREKYRNISELVIDDELKKLADVKEQEVKSEKQPVCDCVYRETKADRKIFADPSKEVLCGSDLQDIWENVSREFPSEYLPPVIDSSVLGYLTSNMGFNFSIDNDFLAMNGITTKFTVNSIDTAQKGLSNIVGHKKACKIVAKAIQSQLERIF